MTHFEFQLSLMNLHNAAAREEQNFGKDMQAQEASLRELEAMAGVLAERAA